MKQQWYYVVGNKYNGSRFYFKTEAKAIRLLKLIESSIFYGEGYDWDIWKEPRA